MATLQKIILTLVCLYGLLCVCVVAYGAEVDGYTLDQWADAIYQAEGGDKAQYPYGIRSIPCKTHAQCRQYAKNTVFNTLVKYRQGRCKTNEDGLSCLARRYAPIGADNDTGTNVHWPKNVAYFLRNPS